MEFELGLRISDTEDDFTPLDVDHFDPSVSRETDSMYILTTQIRGYEREHLEIVIKEDGSRVAIKAHMPFLENWTVGWKIRNVFNIPDGVILDKIKAMFNQEESVLTITMPKAIKGICGIGVEEVKEELVENIAILPDEKKEEQKSEGSELENHDQGKRIVKSTRAVRDRVSQEKGRERPPPVVEKVQVVEGRTDGETHQMQRKTEVEECPRGVTIPKEDKSGYKIGENDASGLKQVAEVCQDEPPKREKEKSLGDEATQGNQSPKKRSVICAPVIAGSAAVVVVIVLVVHLIRNKNRPKRNGN